MNPNNINNSSYKTIMIPAQALDIVKQRLGNDFSWNLDSKSNNIYLEQKPNADTGLPSEATQGVKANMGFDNIPAKLKNRWDD